MSRVFDEKELLDRVDNDWDFLADTIEMLSSDGPALMTEIQRALDSNNPAELSRASHTLKGMISNFCAPAAQASAFEVEKLGKSGDLTSAPPALAALQTNLDALIADLNEFLSTRP
jgi:HPt (histidine-containing phosphotransfer) domain-containing protein